MNSENLRSPITILDDDLGQEYQRRFSPLQKYRQKVWHILTQDFFQKYILPTDTVLDLGCGWGEFINQITAGKRFGMDLNPDSARHLASGITFLHQDCSQTWAVEKESLDVVFTSNFFEHLPSKLSLRKTLEEAHRALRPGGKLICLGPNIKYLASAYWDFWDHHVPLSELSLKELQEISGFEVQECIGRFLPYTMVGKSQAPLGLIRLYLRLPIIWKLFGKQFLLIARKPF